MPPKRKKRFHGLYYHSSPPRVLPMNGQASSETKKKSADDFSVRLSTIRIWMHEKDIGKLTRVLWAGQGNRLRQQASTNPKVKRFLAAVPYVMNTIKDVHQSVVDNSLETLQATMEPPVPTTLITCKDANGLNVIHKAAGLGHTMILEYLLSTWPDGAHETDMTGKTPLHWAASAKNNMRCYTLLTQAGCEEDALDYKMKTPAYYKQKHNEIERSFLTLVPDAPRVSHDIPTDWEALANDDSDDRKKPEIKIPNGRTKSDLMGNGVNLLTSRSEANSIENTSEPDLFEGDNGTEEHPEPPPEETEDIETDDPPLENGHLTNGDGNISEPPTPPETPDDKPDVADENEVEVVDEPPESQQEDENVSNALNDQNNDEANGINEDEDKTNDDDVENCDQKDEDENEIEGENNEEAKENDNEDENPPDNSNGEAEDKNQEEKEDSVHEENNGAEETAEIMKDDEKEESTEEADTKEKTDETDSMKDNNEEDTEGKEEVEQTDNEDEEKNESKSQEEAIDDNADTDGDHDPEGEIENETEASPEQEESQPDDTEAEVSTPEVPPPEVPPPEDSPTDDENNNKKENSTNNGESKEDQKENDDDDDDQDVELAAVDGPQDIKKDENENIPEFDDKMTTDSPTSSLAIEGFVLGDSEDNQVQSESAAYLDDEENYIKAIIESGDMEQLAALVLNGDGKKILNRQSQQPEIQAFLNNVPAYMNKISRVHEASKQGSLYQLQSALDRRKFAIAKDEISPCGASPLHVAVLFGHSDIVRYLAGRFPETTSAVDDDGRTALHYAATIKDNGHFFNLLSHLGGNPKATDKLGNTAEFYTNEEQAKDVLTYKQLLRRFGAETLEDEMLSDQVPDDLHSSRRTMMDVDVTSTLERCFAVIQESSKGLSSASASAVAAKKPISASSLQVQVTSYLGKFLRRSVFDKIKKRQTRLDHNLFDVIWPAMRKITKERKFDEDLNHGIIAPDYDVYVVFQEFLVPLIKDMHCLNLSSEFKPHPRIAYFPIANGERMTKIPFVLDDESKLIVQCTVECSRNLEGFELPLNLNVAQIEQAERAMMAKIFTTSFAKAIGDREAGCYYTLNEVIEENSVLFKMLQDAGLMIPILDMTDRMQEAESLAINGQLWPYGRGVFVNHTQNLALWLNCQEHLRVISSSGRIEAANIGNVYSKVGKAVSYLETKLHFKESYLLGYLSSRPSFLGTGLKMTTTIQLPNLMKEFDNLRHLCSVRGLTMMNSTVKNAVRVINMQSLGATELLLFQDYCTAVTNIISLEKDMSLTNSKHIATMLVKIFRRKKNSKAENYSQNAIFKTEQGRYLASSLGDPLIKGLTEIAEKRPADPVAYLAGFLQNFIRSRQNNRDNDTGDTNSTAIVNSDPEINAHSPKKANGIDSALIEERYSSPESTPKNEDRDEHGQSMLHFACARSHRRNGLLNLIEESQIDVTYRDELYRTARDVSLQANQPGNAKEIDRYVLSLAVVGDAKPFENMAIAGYDHILDIADDEGRSITDVAESRGHDQLVEFFNDLRNLEETREELHQAIRDGDFEKVKEITSTSKGKWLIKAKNYYGRTAMHIAVLKELEEMVEYFVNTSPDALKYGDNLERTPLHYAMGTNSVESISRVLIRKGAKRTTKDLKGRQPSYYFMNKADILRLQEEEDEHR